MINKKNLILKIFIFIGLVMFSLSAKAYNPSETFALACFPQVRIDAYRCTNKLVGGISTCVHEPTGANLAYDCNTDPAANPSCETNLGVCSSNDGCNSSCSCTYSKGHCGVDFSGTPPPAGGPGGCSAGSPFNGLNNCGEVGRDPGSGSCGPGCMCCQLKGSYTPGCAYNISETGYPSCRFSEGGGCNPACQPPIALPGSNCSGCASGLEGAGCFCPSPATCTANLPPTVTMELGDVIALTPAVVQTGGTRGLTGSTFVTSNQNIVSLNPYSSSGFSTNLIGNALGGPVNVAVAILTVDPSNNQPRTACSDVTAVTVVPKAPDMVMDLKVNGSDGPVTIAPGTDVNVTWTSTSADSCVGSLGPVAWNGAKASTNSNQTINVGATSMNLTLKCTNNYRAQTLTDVVQINVNGALPYCTINVPNAPIALQDNNYGTVDPVFTVYNDTASHIFSSTSNTAAFTVEYIPPGAPKAVPIGAPGFGIITAGPAPYTQWLYGQRPSFATLTITGVTATNARCTTTVGVRTTILVCNSPVPHDPPTFSCPTSPAAADGTITWEWEAVPGATSYELEIRRDNPFSGPLVLNSGMRSAAGPGFYFGSECSTTSATKLCRRTTGGLIAGTYYSRVRAAGPACSPSNWSPPTGVDLLACQPWWQAGNGNVISQGSLVSEIPTSCVAPGCVSNLIQNGSGGFPGIALGGSAGTIDTGNGTISPTNWAATSPFTGRQPDYDAFETLIPVSLSLPSPAAAGNNAAGTAFNAGGATNGDGYHWYKHTGPLTITSDVALPANRKVILFVDGNVTINGRITYDINTSFFMIISSGNVNVGAAVSTAGAAPTLTGIFYCDGTFSTGTAAVGGVADGRLNVLGSVVAIGGVTLERDLLTNNRLEPAESFTVSPELLLNYPSALTFKRPIWKEIAP